VISNGKSHCCNDTFTDVRFRSLLAKNTFKNTDYFYAVRISISLAILSEIFIQTGYFFWELCKKTELGVCFWTPCIYRSVHTYAAVVKLQQHCVPKNVSYLIFDNNCGKCGPIFKILAPVDSWENSLSIHLICNVLLHCIVKFENPKMLENFHVKLDD